MSYSFNQRKDTGHQVRKIAADQIDAALETARAGEDFDETVHKLRRRCKKIRGLLRLVRPNFREFETENAAIREAADSLSASRDAAVMVETLSLCFKSEWAGGLSWDRQQQLRDGLTANLQRVAAEQDPGELLEAFAKAMARVKDRVRDWSLNGDGFQLLAPGLRDNYGGMRKRMEKAAKSGDAVDFHEWRKEGKNHWFHVSLLIDSAPAILGPRKDNLDKLGDYLGDHHNIAVLVDTLQAMFGTLEKVLVDGLASEQKQLADKAFALGRQLAVENPAVLTARFGKFWKLLPKED